MWGRALVLLLAASPVGCAGRSGRSGSTEAIATAPPAEGARPGEPMSSPERGPTAAAAGATGATAPMTPAPSISGGGHPVRPSPAVAPPRDDERERADHGPGYLELALPAGFVPLPEQAGEAACGDFRVEILPEPGTEFETFVRVTDAQGKRRYEAHGQRVVAENGATWRNNLFGDFCGDLTGDGVPEIALMESSGGAHCCYTHYVVSLTRPAKRLLMWRRGDARVPLRPVKLREGAAFQLEGRVVLRPSLRPSLGRRGEPELPYSDLPIVPAVLSLRGGQYRLTSLGFPEVYRRNRQAVRDEDGAPWGEGARISWIDSLAIGDWDTEKATLEDAELKALLDSRSPATRDQLLRELGSERRPVGP